MFAIAPRPTQVKVTMKKPSKMVFLVPSMFFIVALKGAKII